MKLFENSLRIARASADLWFPTSKVFPPPRSERWGGKRQVQVKEISLCLRLGLVSPHILLKWAFQGSLGALARQEQHQACPKVQSPAIIPAQSPAQVQGLLQPDPGCSSPLPKAGVGRAAPQWGNHVACDQIFAGAL